MQHTLREHDTAQPAARPRLPAALIALVVTLILIALIFLGSRGFRDFDSALVGYAVATVFTVAAFAYRYTLWISRPPTWRYFRAGWVNFLSWHNFLRYTLLIPRAWWTDIFWQTFILKRGVQRWIMHMAIFWGVIFSLLITIPLTFGWFRFTLLPPANYQYWFFGVPVLVFPIRAGTGFALFHALDFTAALLILGLGIAFWRRLTNAGFLAIQRFNFDLIPLILLLAIAVTGLALTASSLWWAGRFYWFISLTHEVAVVLWLIALPFGKFFHIIERPASIGVTLYQTVNQDVEHYGPAPGRPGAEAGARTGLCRRCGQNIPSRQFLRDLQGVLGDLGQDYQMGDHLGDLQEYCPTCKRVLRGQAYYRLLKNRFL